MKKMNKKGFTLVEIMIVVAIIGLLAAIGIPSFQKARNNSIAKSKTNNTRLVNAAVDQYAMDNALTDGASVTPANYATYLKGGTASLAVGSQTCKNPTATVGTEVSEADMY
jgi:type IV pilus assembly protein PilA